MISGSQPEAVTASVILSLTSRDTGVFMPVSVSCRPFIRLNLISFASLDQAPVVIHQHLRLWNDPPLDPPKELEFQESQLGDADTANTGVCFVGPKTVAEALAGDGGTGDEESVDGETGDGKGGVQSAEPVDIIDHAQQDWG